MKTTIKDLAKLLSLSPSTISRALNDHPDISDRVKDRVKSAASRFNYMPNLHARYFRKKHTGLIAVVLPELHRFFIPDLLKGIETEIEDKDFSLIIFQSHNSYKREIEIIKHCLSWVVEGVLISLADETTNLSHLDMLKDAGIHAVMMDRALDSDFFPSVTIDDELTAYRATHELIKAGRKKIVGLFAAPGLNITANRVDGFRKAIKEMGISKSGEIFLQESDSITPLQDMTRFLREKQDFDGIFAMSDELLSYAMREINANPTFYRGDIGKILISDGS
ncbi:MAG TPA: LacI family DNA-binding transcriptional regulator, partial [Saprospiraceae bacterium]|nr:LacI family DNA-binding transcriptional regulator [Saprospiraceae bacterium]